MTWTVACGRVLLVACLIGLVSCASQDKTKVCSANGETYLCPEDTECGGVQRLCVKPGGCGNGVMDQGEECDDGNTRDGDGCSHVCRNEVCGNGTLDPGEICDDGNNADGDGCSADCLSKETCGNGIVDRAKGEVCDDGIADIHGDPTVTPKDRDGCSADCKSTEVCGNHIIDKAVGEVCDDGNTIGGDGCSADCRSTESCDNSNVDPGEECDHGKFDLQNNPNGNDNGNDCRKDCQFNRCGDGFLDNQGGLRHEQCDTGDPTDLHSRQQETSECNIDCTFAHCGDGKVNKAAGEECDDGTNNGDDRDCTADCKRNVCGDGKPNLTGPAHKEECDDGNLVDTDDCTNHCTSAVCGDGVLRVGEQCDDGDILDGDGCSHDCKFEFCGDGIVNNGEVCDRAKTPATCNLDCTTSRCGDGKLNAAAGEQCDDGNRTSGDGCSHDCTFEHCGNGVVDFGEECDGPLVGLQPCSATCHQERCGNGIRDVDPTASPPVSEQCDDANNLDGDGCSHDCKREFCGDGVTNFREECDPTDPAFGPAKCNTDCTLTHCGDNKLDLAAGEQCDDGNILDGDGCSHDCHFERCGNGILDPQEQCDGTLGAQPCNTATCLQEICGNGIHDIDLGATPPVNEQCDDGNILDGDGCTHDCKFEFCGDGIVNNHEACDRARTPATCNLDCTISMCGDGKINLAAGEDCDDSNHIAGDGCSPDCKFERCGNGVVDPPEECDGPLAGLQPCSPTCHQERCGNGILDVDPGATPVIAEQCDDGNVLDGDGCAHDCKFEHCGNGILDPGEECDGPLVGLQPCSATCHQERCGNGILDIDLGATPPIIEECDDHNPDDGDGCSHDCKFEFCGDGRVDNHEVCDPSVDPVHCNLDCTTSVCGDGKANAAAGEECDDHNPDDGDGCSHDCKFERCGNGILDPGEDCDGPLVGAQPCSPSCHQEVCGNGILDVDAAATPPVHEQCDLGPANNDQGVCTTACQLARCGDTFVETGVEECDTGEHNDNQADCTAACRFNVCGDGLQDTAGPDHQEQCDRGVDNTDHPVCAYNATCTACSTQCLTLTVHHTCGDGVVDSPDEQCDDRNTDACGSCSANCGVVTSHRASGFILAVSGLELSDGETFTLTDGVNPPESPTTGTVFEFDVGDGVADGHVPVVYLAGFTAAEVRQAIEVAIQGEHDAGRLLIAPHPDPSNTNDALVLLTHDRPTSHGNHPITDTVAAPTFFVAGMFGGQGGNCDDGIACGSDDDCSSHHCNAQHTCDTPQAPGAAPRLPATRTARRGP